MPDADIISPVMGDGVYASTLPLFGGLSIWAANPKIVDVLRESGNLFNSHRYEHSYMHCWRHKTPIIYPRHLAVVRGDGRGPGQTTAPTLRADRAGRHRGHRVLPAWGKHGCTT